MSEYIPAATEAAPAEEDYSSAAPRARDAADCSALLSLGAKVLFGRLTDLSFINRISPARGVVRVSKQRLALDLHVHERTIARWCDELETHRFVWTRTVWWSGRELTLWHLRGMADSEEEFFRSGDLSVADGRSQKRERNLSRDASGVFRCPACLGKSPATCPRCQARAARKALGGENGQSCHHGGPEAKSTEMPQMSAVSGQACPETTDQPIRGPRINRSVDHGQDDPWSTDKPIRGPRTNGSVVNGQDDPSSTDNPVRDARTGMSELGVSKERLDRREESSKAVIRLGNRAQEATGKAGKPAGRRSAPGEEDFLAQVEEVIGRFLMHEERWQNGKGKGHGGLFAMAYRSNRAKALGCLAELGSMVKEGRVKTNVMAAWNDLWKRDRLKFDRKAVAA